MDPSVRCWIAGAGLFDNGCDYPGGALGAAASRPLLCRLWSRDRGVSGMEW